MEYLLAGIAFLVSLAAIYLASEAVKKVERQIQEFLGTHLKILNESIAANTEAMGLLKSRMGGVEKDMQAIKNVQTETWKLVGAHVDDLKRLREELQALDRSILPQSKKSSDTRVV